MYNRGCIHESVQADVRHEPLLVWLGDRTESHSPNSGRHRRVVLDRAKLREDAVELIEVVEEVEHWGNATQWADAGQIPVPQAGVARRIREPIMRRILPLKIRSSSGREPLHRSKPCGPICQNVQGL